MKYYMTRAALLLTLCISTSSMPAADPKPARNEVKDSKPKEDFGYDVHNGVTNKIARIATVDPRYIWVVYEDGVSGRKIPRSELPPQLQARFPYDPKKAAESIEARAAENRALIAQHKQGLQQKERDLTAQIDAIERQRGENQKEIGNLNRKINTAPRSKVLKGEKLKLLEQQNDLRERKAGLEARLKQVQAQLDSLK